MIDNDATGRQVHQRLWQLLALVEKEDAHLHAVRQRLFGRLSEHDLDAQWLTRTLATPEGIDRLESFGAKFSRL